TIRIFILAVITGTSLCIFLFVHSSPFLMASNKTKRLPSFRFYDSILVFSWCTNGEIYFKKWRSL
ncbi:MAG: hypothetical protein ACI9Q9_000326, partial [Flavobacterium sp.]